MWEVTVATGSGCGMPPTPLDLPAGSRTTPPDPPVEATGGRHHSRWGKGAVTASARAEGGRRHRRSRSGRITAGPRKLNGPRAGQWVQHNTVRGVEGR
ncbi:hypothetical protein [Oryza sativa Japonica Group]|uniref:Uncharacterized protein n=1 Tax=Oryza sativa subsp. japonica TaxID=39947 RepID=Q94EB3_ORYSJ|nr:hypothetical protein [Oryza sativa Japonica Group]BAD45124.1 hypothetical protein [Oryza sativa Japonica Group]